MKKIFGIALFLAFAGYSIYSSQSKEIASDILLENVEAFGYVNPEIGILGDFHLQNHSNGCSVCERGGVQCNIHDQVPC